MIAIKINNVSKKMKDNLVLDKICLELEENNIYGFTGINGSGKTMLFRAICGLIIPNEGEIHVFGKQLGKDISFPENLGIVIENIGLWRHLSGYENLKLLSKIRKTASDKDIQDAIQRVGLDPYDKRPIKKYSLGMKQRIVIAQAIMEKPKLLILDEPTNSLDLDGIQLIHEIIIQEQRRGATILLSSHNVNDIDTLCNATYKMVSGRIADMQDGCNE